MVNKTKVNTLMTSIRTRILKGLVNKTKVNIDIHSRFRKRVHGHSTLVTNKTTPDIKFNETNVGQQDQSHHTPNFCKNVYPLKGLVNKTKVNTDLQSPDQERGHARFYINLK